MVRLSSSSLLAVLIQVAVAQSCTLNDIVGTTFDGMCSYDSLIQSVTDKTDCDKAGFDSLFGGDEGTARLSIFQLCHTADVDSRNDFVPWSDITKRGYQFDKEFFDGNTAFNQEYATADNNLMLSDDVARMKSINSDVLDSHGIQWPGHIYNFNETTSCQARAAMCCWTADRDEVGAGSCSGTGCLDEEPESSGTDVCLVNMTKSPLASHVKRGEAFFSGATEGVVNCHGFAWDEGASDLDNKYKGNLLFKVGMMEGLVDNGYVGSVPGAPMCGCVEQMPIVSKAKCTDIEIAETWEIGVDSYTGNAIIELKHADIQLQTCLDQGVEVDLATYYKTAFQESIDHYVAADCEAAETEWLSSYELGYRRKATLA